MGDVIDGSGSIDHVGQDAAYDHLEPLLDRVAETAARASIAHRILGVVLDGDSVPNLPHETEKWRHAIGETLAPFRSMPEPSGFDWELAEVVYAARLVHVTPGTTGAAGGPGDSTADLDIGGTLNELDTRAGQLKGETAKTFYGDYVTKVPGLMGNVHAAIGGQALGLAAEQQLWERARADFVAIAKEADAAFARSFPDSGGDGLATALTITAAILGAAAAVASLGGGAVLTAAALSANLASIGAGTAASLIGGEPEEATVGALDGEKPEDVLSNLQHQLRRFNEEIVKEERRIETLINEVLNAVGDSARFDIASPELLRDTCASHVLDDTQIVLDKGDIRTITHGLIPDVAGRFDKSAEVRSAPSQGHWSRGGGIGLGGSGPFGSYVALDELITLRARDASFELRASAEHLDLAAKAIGTVDDAANKKLRAHTRELGLTPTAHAS